MNYKVNYELHDEEHNIIASRSVLVKANSTDEAEQFAVIMEDESAATIKIISTEELEDENG